MKGGLPPPPGAVGPALSAGAPRCALAACRCSAQGAAPPVSGVFTGDPNKAHGSLREHPPAGVVRYVTAAGKERGGHVGPRWKVPIPPKALPQTKPNLPPFIAPQAYARFLRLRSIPPPRAYIVEAS